ncbi:B-cell receptor CD22 [Parambassis ranga]|uniref:B-cell receptor CD22 n=1 Tax=Parambassis ranga TaxID=210632 RepID=A0A6P7JUH6_9TELE|nr:B-cell receptor CD22-like [Parambassis ranga]XP_028280614.1 B-cell receptor CD22-like [Parambassis ranga]
MHHHVVRCLLLLVLIQNFSGVYPAIPQFILDYTELKAVEGSCVEIKCTVQQALNTFGAYWFWIKDAKYIESRKDFDGINIYSTNTEIRPVNESFANRVEYVGTSWTSNSPQKLCSVLICDLKISDSGNYSFRFVSQQNKWITKPAANLKVDENPCLVTFETPPPVEENATITLKCSTSSKCQSYPQINQAATTDAGTSKSTTYSFSASWTQNGTVFSCQTQDNKDQYLIRNISISVEYGPKEIVAKASSENVKEGQAVHFFCSGKGNPGLTFNWSHSGTNLSNKANWTIPSINDSQGGQYSCTAQNKHGRQTSNITINVQYAPYVKILRNPERSDITEGEKVTFECIVTRSNPPSRSIDLLINSSLVRQSGESYVIESIKPEDSGNYTCLAENSVGSRKSENSTLQVHFRPRNTKIDIDGAKNGNVKVTHGLTFTCSTKAYPAPQYSWYHYNQNEPSVWAFKGHERQLILSNVQREDKGCYVCNATNTIGKGNPSTPECIKVLFPPTRVSLSMDAEVTEGRPVTVTCTAESFPPSTFKFSMLPDQHSIDENHQTTTNTYHYTFNATWTHAGNYTCRATNSEGFKQSTQRPLVVKYAPKDVKVEAHPGLLVKENTSFNLTCSARSNPAVTSVYWMKMDNEKNERVWRAQGSLIVKSASPSDSGLYSCRATNDIGSKQSQQVEVKVKYAPKHTKIVQGAEQREPDGTRSVLLICSSHCYPLATKYTWHKKLADKKYDVIAKKQNVTVTSQESGEYYCIAENELGLRHSDPVVVFDDRMKTWKIVLFCLLFLIIFCLVLLFGYRRKKSAQQQSNTNTQPPCGFPVWLSRGRNPLNDAEPFRSRDDLLPQQPSGPRAQRCQAAGPDTTPASNVSTVYSTVNLPQKNLAASAQKPVKQHRHTDNDALNYASLHFGNKHTKEANDVYAKVSKPKAKEKEQEKQGTTRDYENVSAACASDPQNLWESESDTSEDEVEVNYSQVTFKPRHGHKRDSSTSSSSSSSDDKTQYSEVKL